MSKNLPHLKPKPSTPSGLHNRLVVYSAAAAAVFAATDARGQVMPAATCEGDVVVHCDIDPDLVLPNNNGQIVFDFNGDGTKDIILINQGGTNNSVLASDCAAHPLCMTDGPAFGPQFRRGSVPTGTQTQTALGGTPNAFLGDTGGYASALSSGDPISPGNPNFQVNNIFVGFSTVGGASSGNFPGQGDKYLGIRFDIPGGSPHMGWVRLNMPGNFGQVLVKAFGYHTQADQTVQAGQGPLPVELASFDAEVTDTRVTLSWQTAGETNNFGFEIQRRTGEQPWQNLGFVDGNGTTLEAQPYSFRTEALTPGHYQFRLKQMDFDGSFEFSPVVEVVVEVPGTHALLPAYPNPFNPSTQLTLVVAREQHVQLAVYDVTGRPVQMLHEGILSEDTQHSFRFEAGDLPGGLYMIRVTGENFTDTQQVMLVK